MLDNEKKKDFSKRLNQALDLRKYPDLGGGRISYVQEIFLLSRAGANKWIHGKSIPHRKKRILIAEKLGINLHWLETGEGDPLDIKNDVFTPVGKIHRIPILTPTQIYLKTTVDEVDNTDSIFTKDQFPAGCFAMEHIGTSMEPKYYSGVIFIIDPNASIEDGDYVVSRSRLIPEATARQYISGFDTDYLIAMNNKFEPIKIPKGEHEGDIFGKILAAKQK